MSVKDEICEIWDKFIQGETLGEGQSYSEPEEKNVLLDKLKAENASLRAKLFKVEAQRDSLEVENDNIRSEKRQLSADNQTLLRQVSDMGTKLERAGHLEVTAPGLLDWIQSVIGYAENKSIFSVDTDELSQFRADVKRLPSLLRANGIQCVCVPTEEGLGFIRMRDARVANGAKVVSAPMLLRGGMIIAEGIILVSDTNEFLVSNDLQVVEQENDVIQETAHSVEELSGSDLTTKVCETPQFRTEKNSDVSDLAVDRPADATHISLDFEI